MNSKQLVMAVLMATSMAAHAATTAGKPKDTTTGTGRGAINHPKIDTTVSDTANARAGGNTTNKRAMEETIEAIDKVAKSDKTILVKSNNLAEFNKSVEAMVTDNPNLLAMAKHMGSYIHSFIEP